LLFTIKKEKHIPSHHRSIGVSSEWYAEEITQKSDFPIIEHEDISIPNY